MDPVRTQVYNDLSNFEKLLSKIGRGPWPGGTSSWGNSRTWLTPIEVPNLYNRSGFTIHGGDEPGSAGCIDLTGSNDAFHKWLKDYGKPVDIRVKY